MALGIRRDLGTINVGDSAELRASVEIDEVPVPDSDIDSVTFLVQKPGGTTSTVVGTIESDGLGFFRWLDTTTPGHYAVQARFLLNSGEIRSTMLDFQVEDPFNPSPLTADELIADQVWVKIEDAFDSELGGPWLRDMSLRYFDKRKIPQFFPEALTEINIAPPMTQAGIHDFSDPNTSIVITDQTSITETTNISQSIFVQAATLAVIRHLMRSYVEQPAATGAQIAYEDRRDYLQRWQAIYEIEKERYERWLPLWKRQFLHLGRSALLVANKAGRLSSPGMRTRNATRGWY